MPSRSERVIEELRAQLKLADEVNFKLRHNLSQQLRADERIWTDGGVNSDGKPFVTIRWGSEGAQMSTSETRAFALTLIQTADAAEYDAALFTAGRRDGMDEQTLGALITMAREFRNVEADTAGRTKTETTPIKEQT
jgi:hypothetical protein